MTGASKWAAIGFATFIGLVFAMEMWGDYTRDKRVEADKIARAAQDAKWAAEHPAEAAALDAKWRRSEARMMRMFDAMAACRGRSPAEATLACQQEVRRREALDCLLGADWRDCEAINR